MRSLVALALFTVVAASAACKKHAPEIQVDQKVDEHTATRAATFDDVADPKPALTVHADGDLQAGILAGLPADPAGKLDVSLAPAAPPTASDGEFVVAVTVKAMWWALPEVRTATTTLSLKLTYWSSDAKALGKAIGDHVSDYVRHTRPEKALAPVAAPAATQVAVAHDLACSLHVDGSVHCWGDAVGTVVGAVPSPSPIKGATQLAASDHRVCALLATGDVQCIGKLEKSPNPTSRICHVEGAKQIALGNDTGCVLGAGGKVWCWPVDKEHSTTPNCDAEVFPVSGVDGATAIAVGFQGGCALVGDKLTCWQASQGAGSLDAGDFSKLGAAVAPLYGYHPCALGADGKLTCVDGKTLDPAPPITTVPPGSKIAMSPAWGCALPPDGSLQCFGANTYHQIEPSGGDHADPYKLPGLDHVTSASMAPSNACAVANGAVFCWGGGIDGHTAPLGIADKVASRPTKITVY